MMPSLRTALAVACCAASSARAQLPRAERPTPGPPPRWRFPRVSSQRLTNGLKVLIVEDHAVPVVAVRLDLGIDSLLDPVGREGLATVTSLAMGDATTSESPAQLADAQAMIGTKVGVSGFTTTTENFASAARIMGDMVSSAAVSTSAVDRAKAQIIVRVGALRRVDVPRHAFLSIVYGYEAPFLRHATDSSVARITLSDVVAFRRRFINPERATLIVVGDVRLDQVLDAAKQAFGSWKRGDEPSRAVPTSTARSPLAPTTIYLMDVPGALQANTWIGYAGPPRASPDRAALDGLSWVLGAGAGSRLLSDLRDRRAYFYSGSGFLPTWRGTPLPSTLWGFAAVNPAKIDSTLEYWIAGWRSIAGENPISDSETEAARLRVLVSTRLRLETPDGIASELLSSVENHEPIDEPQRYIDAATSMTTAELNRVAHQYLEVNHLAILVAGDRKTVEPLLRSAHIAPIVVIDESGHPISDR